MAKRQDIHYLKIIVVVAGEGLLEVAGEDHLVVHLPWEDKILEALVVANKYK